MIDRIRELLSKEQLSPSQFADEINLQRSSLSHVLSGRNKPSLDFVMKIKQRFSDVNLEWLIFGNGNMFLGQGADIVSNVNKPLHEIISDESQHSLSFDLQNKTEPAGIIKDEDTETYNVSHKTVVSGPGNANKVIIFYKNGTFEEFTKG